MGAWAGAFFIGLEKTPRKQGQLKQQIQRHTQGQLGNNIGGSTYCGDKKD
jgi:hypothetical protein